MSSERLTRLSKPLRCTSLHQTILAGSPSATNVLPIDNLLSPAGHFSDDEESNGSRQSSDAESAISEIAVDETSTPAADSYNLRRNSSVLERRQRRASSGFNLTKFKPKGLSLGYTSLATTAHAINEVFGRRELIPTSADNVAHSPEAERAQFLAELPGAIARARKVHYRRDALLPKTKSFNRVQDSLKEDCHPSESDAKKEAALAMILKTKAVDVMEADVLVDDLNQAMSHSSRLQLERDTSSMSEGALSIDSSHGQGERAFRAFEREETLFSMEDINTSVLRSAPCSPSTVPHGAEVITDHLRSNQSRNERRGKRRNEDNRYDPYYSTKRRAISPSPGSPLGSPPVKGASIFKISDLTL